MASKQPRLTNVVLAEVADDFEAIRGIGPVKASHLHDAGIHTYAQLASLSPTDLATRVTGLSASQIAKQKWIGQARRLASKNATPKPRKEVMPTIRQHYENFTVEFLLDEKNTVRRTRVVHVQSGDENIWTGWGAKQLIDFLAQYTEGQIQPVKLATQEIAIPDQQHAQKETVTTSPIVMRTSDHAPSAQVSTKIVQSVDKPADHVSQPYETSNLKGTLQLRDLRVLLLNSDSPIFFLRQGQLYLLELTLDFTQVALPSDAILLYKAVIIAKQLNGPHRPLVEASNTFKPSNNTIVQIVGSNLSPGVYCLEASARLTFDEAAPGLTAFLKGSLLQVY